MGLNKSKGNMYDFVTHTWNTIKGECYHDCSYCYMKRWGKLNPVRFDEKELKSNLGEGNYIFVGSSCDMWAEDIDAGWIIGTLNKCKEYDNEYLFQTKNPERVLGYIYGMLMPKNSVICTTIESNKYYPDIMNKSPELWDRAKSMNEIAQEGFKTYVTIEPIMDFDVSELIEMIYIIEPIQVNIGADSGKNNLPEPSKEKVLELIRGLEKFTKVKQKKNLKRLLK